MKSTDIIQGGNALWIGAAYLVTLGSVFYMLWLLDIIPASLVGSTPPSLQKVELFTNPVHVLDLSIILPAFIFTGVLVLGGKWPGMLLMPVMLIFAALMSFTIAGLQVAMHIGNLNSNLVIAAVMIVLGSADIALFRRVSNTGHRTGAETPAQVVNFN